GNRARILQRWRDGRIEIQGGTLRVPESPGSPNALSLQIRRASLRRADEQWSISGLLFLPERLGRLVNVFARLEGDLTQPRSLSGYLRFDGRRLTFANWRELLGGDPMSAARLLP